MGEFSNLQTFVTVARAGSFSAAASQLGLSAAMVGRRVQAIEDTLGTRLIERTTRSQRLTEAGTQFLNKASDLLEAYAQLTEIGGSADDKTSGRVRVSGPTTLGTKKLAGIVARLVETAPELVVELSLSDRRVDLIADGFDLAIRIGHLASSGMIARRVGTYRFVCCASPSYLKRYGIPLSPPDLAAARCILNGNLNPRGKWVFKAKDGKTVSANVRGQMELDHDEAHRMAALSGAGLIYVPLHLVEDDLRSGMLVEVLANWEKPELPIFALHPSKSHVPRRVSVVIAAVAEGLRH